MEHATIFFWLGKKRKKKPRFVVMLVECRNLDEAMRLFPLFLKLNGRLCLIVGAGTASEGKIAGLLSTGAKIRVVSPEVTPTIAKWHRDRRIQWVKHKFRKGDLAGAYLVIAATGSNHVHRAIHREAHRRGILCNVVDTPELCDFYYGSVLQRGDLQIAISTAGASPSLAKRLRKKFEAEFEYEYADWLKSLTKERRKIRGRNLAAHDKLRLLEELASESAFMDFQQRLKNQHRTN